MTSARFGQGHCAYLAFACLALACARPLAARCLYRHHRGWCILTVEELASSLHAAADSQRCGSWPRQCETFLSTSASVFLSIDAAAKSFAPICLAVAGTIFLLTMLCVFYFYSREAPVEKKPDDGQSLWRFSEVFGEGALGRGHSHSQVSQDASKAEAAVSEAPVVRELLSEEDQWTTQKRLCPFIKSLNATRFEVIGRITRATKDRELAIYVREHPVFAIFIRSDRIMLGWHGFSPEHHDPLGFTEKAYPGTGSPTLNIRGMRGEVYAKMALDPESLIVDEDIPPKLTWNVSHTSSRHLFDIENVPRFPVKGLEDKISCVRCGKEIGKFSMDYKKREYNKDSNSTVNKCRSMWVKDNEDSALVILAIFSALLLHPDRARLTQNVSA